MSENSGAANQIISLPKGGGAVKGIGETFQPNLFTGTGNFTIPIATSPGRAGFGPQLSLQYSTGNGNGLFGLGWQLSIPRITCKTEKGLPRYDEGDIFVMSGAEDLVPSLQQVDEPPPGYTIIRYRPRTEGLFARIEKWVSGDGDVHWRATTKDNVTSIYGRTDQARIAHPDPDKRHHIYEWLIQETYDAKGNHILYEYAADEPALDLGKIYEENRKYCQRYIRRIYYGNFPDPLVDDNGDPITYDGGAPIGHERIGTDHKNPTSQISRRYAFEVVFDYGRDVQTGTSSQLRRRDDDLRRLCPACSALAALGNFGILVEFDILCQYTQGGIIPFTLSRMGSVQSRKRDAVAKAAPSQFGSGVAS